MNAVSAHVLLGDAEAIAAGAIWGGGDDAERGSALERLVDTLLFALAGIGPRATDGLIILRDEIDPATYFAVAKVFMIDDQRVKLASVELAADTAKRITGSALLRFGVMASGRGHRLGQSEAKRENMLLAYPRHAVESFRWAHTFTRTPAGWTRVAAESSESA